MRFRRFASSAAALVGAVLLGGCAWVQKEESMGTERELAAAGFRMQFANTPERVAQVQNLPPRKLVPVNKDGDVVWVYSDPQYCGCVYVGDQKAYGRYQKLQIQETIASEQEAAAMNWGVWGPWW